MRLNLRNFRVFGRTKPSRTGLKPFTKSPRRSGWRNISRKTRRRLALQGRVMEMLSEHTVEGWLEGYILSGRHGFINSYEPIIHVIDSMFNQHAKWLEKCNELPWRANVASLNLLITALVWRQDHNGFTHQDPGFLDVVANKSPALCASICRRTLTACFLWLTTASEALTMSVIVADKQVHLQYLDMDAATAHCTKARVYGLGQQ